MPAGLSLIILVGGRSLRMGQDKATLPAGNGTIVERIIGRLAPVSDDVILAGDRLGRAPLGTQVVPDHYPGAGPLAGIHAGLRAARREHAWVVGCDLPDVDPALGAFLLGAAGELDAAVPRIAGLPQGVCAVYAVTLVPRIEARLAAGQRSIAGLLEASAVRYLEEFELRAIDPELRSFRNLNTPADYEVWLRARPARP